MTKMYNLGHAFQSDWKMTVEIDHEIADKQIKEMVEFWRGWEFRLSENEFDYTVVFLKQLAHEVFCAQVAECYNLTGIIEHFNKLEGWTPIDGSMGITIKEVSSDAIEFRHFKVSPVKELHHA